ncbi:MAG: histidine--tRNA ligase [Nitrospirae bacterium]|nr:histidine--tRNA ligase [Nitrospirota bacterium]
MQDILPPDIFLWQTVEQTARQIFSVYGFQEIRTPIMESTAVFSRSIGESTDIVEKEMYTFTDKGDRSLSLRPEGTASVVRSYVEHHLDKLPAPQKFYYTGPMFRYERPQSGRFRQFYQIGVEAFADSSPRMDAEVIAMLGRLLTGIGLKGISFQINSIGCAQCRPGYRDVLLEFFSEKKEDLCDDCKRRYDKNPLRILDCKASTCRQQRQGAPKITDHLCADCRSHFEKLQSLLSLLQVPYSLNADMVRGLDYYTRTTFEVTSQSLGAQNAVAAGGRYDKLVQEFGGPETPAVGFALGMERVIELLKKTEDRIPPTPAVYFAVLGDAAGSACLVLAEQLRKQGLWAEVGDAASSLKSQMRRADRMAVRYVFIMGDDELRLGMLKWKNLAGEGQGELKIADMELFLEQS